MTGRECRYPARATVRGYACSWAGLKAQGQPSPEARYPFAVVCLTMGGVLWAGMVWPGTVAAGWPASAGWGVVMDGGPGGAAGRASAKRGLSDPARQCAIGGRAGAGSDLITPEFLDAPRIVLIPVLFQDKLRSV
jgi:hypothetical protein